jgi:hypothetical protein
METTGIFHKFQGSPKFCEIGLVLEIWLDSAGILRHVECDEFPHFSDARMNYESDRYAEFWTCLLEWNYIQFNPSE